MNVRPELPEPWRHRTRRSEPTFWKERFWLGGEVAGIAVQWVWRNEDFRFLGYNAEQGGVPVSENSKAADCFNIDEQTSVPSSNCPRAAPPGYSPRSICRYGRHDPRFTRSKVVSTGAPRDEQIEPQSFVAGGEMSASALTAMRISYVHAGIEVLHFVELPEIHRIIGIWEGLVHFILQVLITGGVEQQVVKNSG